MHLPWSGTLSSLSWPPHRPPCLQPHCWNPVPTLTLSLLLKPVPGSLSPFKHIQTSYYTNPSLCSGPTKPSFQPCAAPPTRKAPARHPPLTSTQPGSLISDTASAGKPIPTPPGIPEKVQLMQEAPHAGPPLMLCFPCTPDALPLRLPH